MARQTVLSSQPTRIVTADGGDVTVRLEVNDLNPGDTYTADWSQTSGALVDLDGGNPDTLVFNPAGLAAGLYLVRVTVTDNGAIPASSCAELLLQVVSTYPLLSNDNDSDGDGTGDADEGIADSDGDGIPDYLDASDDTTLLPLTNGREIQGPYGMTLALGGIAFASGQTTAMVSANDIANHGDPDYGPTANGADSGAAQTIGYFDFQVTGLASPGQVLQLVIPLGEGESIPEGAVYRKYRPGGGWSSFVGDASNALASTARDGFDHCPPPGHPSYTHGLTAGDQCIELTVQEGGANDGDGEFNGVYRDPSAVAVINESVRPRPLRQFLQNLLRWHQCIKECKATQAGFRLFLCNLGCRNSGSDTATLQDLGSSESLVPAEDQPTPVKEE